jgi:nucleoside-diphosphate-sugar epimerase
VTFVRIAITGGLGFIGTHLADAYLGKGHQVLLVDSGISAVSDGTDYADRDDATIIVHSSVEGFLAQGGSFDGYDLVIHAASLVGPAGILDYTASLGAMITTAAQAVVEDCARHGVPVVLFSSAEVYGRSGQLAETDPLMIPAGYNTRIEYAVAKALTEIVLVNARAHGLLGVILRPFNVTGARQSAEGGFVMPTFVQQALAGRPLTVFEGGDQTRAFTAVADLARFCTDYLQAAFASDKVIFNIGNPANQTTINDLAIRVRDLAGSTSPIVQVDPKTIHGRLYEPAVSRQKVPVLRNATELGWQPQIGLDALMAAAIAYYRHYPDHRASHAHR